MNIIGNKVTLLSSLSQPLVGLLFFFRYFVPDKKAMVLYRCALIRLVTAFLDTFPRPGEGIGSAAKLAVSTKTSPFGRGGTA